jgi:predicted nucleotidyltransferase
MAPRAVREVIERYKAALAAAGFPPFEVVLYGSYARREARPDSDIDLCLISPAFARGRLRHRRKAVQIAFETDPRIQVVLVDPRTLATNTLSPLWSAIRRESIAA